MNEEARVAQLCDLLRQKLHTSHRVAEDDGLIDLKLGEERVQAVDLSPPVGSTIYLSIHTYIHTYLCMYVYIICMYRYVYIYNVHVYIYIYIYIYIVYIYMCVCG